MARRKARTLTEVELEIMQVIWQRQEVTVPDLQQALEEQGKPLALPSIRTMLSILLEKGYVARRGGGRRHLYRATVPREDAEKRILQDIVERAFRGSASQLVAALIDTDMLSDRELTDVKKLIGKREKEGER